MTSHISGFSRPRFRHILREKELWILILVVVIYFFPPLLRGKTFFNRDIYLRFLPQSQLLADFIRVGEIPLWDPYVQGGQPFLGSLTSLALYPKNLLYFFFPPLQAFNLSIVLNAIGGIVFAYLLARVIGLQPLSGLVATGTYGFCGYTHTSTTI